ncbi:MAG: alanine--tRNA ligase, partial [Planctomycetota bacterium]
QDLDVVGTTAYHQTFFEMLGNFSFGDYFKKEAITWAWEFLTEVLQLDTGKLYVSVYENDQAAYDIWRNDVGLAPERIQRLGPKDNFWPANAPEDGPNGPCGPCSEIFFDYGGDYPDWQTEPDSPRFAEIWNLVFTQFDRQDGGKLEPLPQQNIDTGMGFERINMVIQGKETNFDTDLLRPLMDHILQLAGKRDGDFDGVELQNQRRVADHAKAATFCVVDGVRPGNEGRPYVLRKVIRRAVRDGRSLGIRGAFVHELSAIVAGIYRRAYPEVTERLAMVQRTIKAEEERFLANLDRGETLVADVVATIQKAGGREVSGAQLFELFATHGQPLDMTEPLFEAAGLAIDRAGYDAAMEEHRRASKGDGGMADEIFQRSAFTDISKHTEFLAWETMQSDATVLGLLDLATEGGALAETAGANAKIEVLLDRSPFYAESGGQIGDTGVLRGPNGVVKVTDTQKLGGIIRHIGAVIEGTVAVGETVVAAVDVNRRRFVTENHTATHLMHAALRADRPDVDGCGHRNGRAGDVR